MTGRVLILQQINSKRYGYMFIKSYIMPVCILFVFCVFSAITTPVMAKQISASCTISSSFLLDNGKATPYFSESLIGQARSISYDETSASVTPNLTAEPENYHIMNEFDLLENEQWRYLAAQKYRSQILYLDNPMCTQGKRDRTLTQYDISSQNVLRLRAICPCEADGKFFQPAIP